MFKVTVIGERCKECGICIEFCPRKVLKRGDKYNSRGYRYTIVAYPEKCIGCRLCEMMCPDFAIFVE